MIVAESLVEEKIFPSIPVKIRTESTSSVESNLGIQDTTSTVRNLELEGVKELFQDYDLLEAAEAVACVICGTYFQFPTCLIFLPLQKTFFILFFFCNQTVYVA